MFIKALKSLSNLHFDWSLLCKVYNVGPKKYKRVIFHDNEMLCKISRRIDSWFQKRHEEFGEFSPGHSEISKFSLSWATFVQSI